MIKISDIPQKNVNYFGAVKVIARIKIGTGMIYYIQNVKNNSGLVTKETLIELVISEQIAGCKLVQNERTYLGFNVISNIPIVNLDSVPDNSRFILNIVEIPLNEYNDGYCIVKAKMDGLWHITEVTVDTGAYNSGLQVFSTREYSELRSQERSAVEFRERHGEQWYYKPTDIGPNYNGLGKERFDRILQLINMPNMYNTDKCQANYTCDIKGRSGRRYNIFRVAAPERIIDILGINNVTINKTEYSRSSRFSSDADRIGFINRCVAMRMNLLTFIDKLKDGKVIFTVKAEDKMKAVGVANSSDSSGGILFKINDDFIMLPYIAATKLEVRKRLDFEVKDLKFYDIGEMHSITGYINYDITTGSTSIGVWISSR